LAAGPVRRGQARIELRAELAMEIDARLPPRSGRAKPSARSGRKCRAHRRCRRMLERCPTGSRPAGKQSRRLMKWRRCCPQSKPRRTGWCAGHPRPHLRSGAGGPAASRRRDDEVLALVILVGNISRGPLALRGFSILMIIPARHHALSPLSNVPSPVLSVAGVIPRFPIT